MRACVRVCVRARVCVRVCVFASCVCSFARVRMWCGMRAHEFRSCTYVIVCARERVRVCVCAYVGSYICVRESCVDFDCVCVSTLTKLALLITVIGGCVRIVLTVRPRAPLA